MRTGKYIYLVVILILALSFTACEEDIPDPIACYTLTVATEDGSEVISAPFSVETGQIIDFKNCGIADYYSFFSGTAGHIWEDYINPEDSVTTGTDAPSGNFNLSYGVAGEYHASVVLTNRRVKEPTDYKQEIVEFIITVTDP